MKKLAIVLGLTFLALCSTINPSTASTNCTNIYSSIAPLEIPANNDITIHTYPPRLAWLNLDPCFLLSRDNQLFLYDIANPDSRRLLAQTEAGSSITQVAVNPVNANIAFSVRESNVVYIISLNDDLTTLTANGDSVTALEFSPDGTHLAVASSTQTEIFLTDATIEIWNAQDHPTNLLQSRVDILSNIDFSDDSQFILSDGFFSGYFGNHVEFWDLATNERLWDNETLLDGLAMRSDNDPLAPTSAILQANTAFLAGVDGYFNDNNFYGYAVHIWDANTQERQREIILFRRNGEEEFDTIYTVNGPTITANQSASRLATTIGNGIIQLWDTNNGNLLVEFDIDQTATHQLSFNVDDRYLAAVSGENVIVLDLVNSEIIANIPLEMR